MNNNYLTNNAKRYLFEFDEILNKMAQKMLSWKITTSIIDDSITCMIPHHAGAIEMCNNLLKYSISPELCKIATDIIMQQTEGIKILKEIQQQLYK